MFRELEAYDFYVPDQIFEQQINPEKKDKVEHYIVPMETFWRPVHIDGEVCLDLKSEKYI